MKRGIEHIQIGERAELTRAIDMILEEFEDELALAKHDWKVNARITKIILYGSRARGDWVDEHYTRVGKHSDWDLMVLVNDPRLTDRNKYWKTADERLMREYMYTHRLRSPAHFFVYTIEQINASLEGGRYFFLDFLRDGIIVYEADDAEFVNPKPLPRQRSFEMAKEYFDDWFEGSVEYFENYEHSRDRGRLKNAAFQLHQCVERLYHTVLLTFTLYTPHNHNIVVLRNSAEQHAPCLVEAWPRDTDFSTKAFETLQQAYVKARYVRDFHMTEDQLRWLGEHSKKLIALVEESCKAHLSSLKAALQP